MNPESPTPREEVEAKLTALLLGELPADEAFALGRTIERDAELARLYSHLKQTIGLLREAAVRPVEQTVAQTSSLKLSDSRREKLLAHFKTVTPKDFAEPKRPAFSWLVPVAAAAAFVAIAGAMLLPALSKAKNKAQSISIISNLRQIDVAKEQWAVENRKSANAEPTMNELKPYLGREIASVAGEKYVVGKVGEPSAADLRAVEPRLSSRTWSLVHSSGRESDQRSRLLADGRRVSAERSGDSVAILPSTEQQPGPVAELPGPAAKTVELAGTSGQSRSGGIVLPSSADFENKQNLSALPIRALRSPAATNAVGALGFAPQGGGGGGGAGGSIGGGGGSLAGGRGGADEKAPVPGQVVSIDEGNAAVARIASMPSSFPIDPTTGLPATSRPVQAVDPKTGLPIVVAEQAWANPPVREALAPGIATTAPGIQSSAPAENEVSQRLYKFAYSKGEVVDKTTEQKIAMDSSSNGKPLTTTYNEPSSDEFQKKSKPAQAGDKGALQLMPSAAPDPARYMPTAEVAVTKAMSMAVASSLPKKVEQEIYLGKALAQVPQAKQAYDADLRKPGPAQLAEAPNARPLDLAALTNIAKSEVLAWSIEAPATLRPPAATEIAQKKVNELLKESESAEAVLVKTNAVALRSAPEPRKELDEPAKPRVVTPAPEPQPEFQVRENAFSTFSMNVSDVSFKLAAASLEKGQMPDVASIRSEEFINAFDYRDPEAIAGVPVAFAWERTRYPFAHNRDLLRFSIKTAAAGRQPGRPLNVVLLLDNSGSMERADRVQIIREALRVLAGQLQSQDKLSVVTFARTARLWVDGVSGDHAGKVAEDLSGLTPQGGTNLEEAMNLAYQTAARHYLANGINRVVLLTDGAANLGDVEPESLKQKVEAQRKQGIALDCFGIGWEGFNDDLLEVLSRHGDGRYGFINTPEEAATEFAGQLAGALHVAAADVKVQVEFNPNRVTAYRQIGYAKHQLTKEQFRDNAVDAAEIGAAESGNALYVIETNPSGQGPVAMVRVRYKVPGTGDYREQEWPVPYTGSAISLEQASAAMRLAASASAFSEWLAGSPYAAEVTPDRLLGYLRGVPEVYGADARPKRLEWMIRQAKSVTGK